MKVFGIFVRLYFFFKAFEDVFKMDVNALRNHKLKLWGWEFVTKAICYSDRVNFLILMRCDSFLRI